MDISQNMSTINEQAVSQQSQLDPTINTLEGKINIRPQIEQLLQAFTQLLESISDKAECQDNEIEKPKPSLEEKIQTMLDAELKRRLHNHNLNKSEKPEQELAPELEETEQEQEQEQSEELEEQSEELEEQSEEPEQELEETEHKEPEQEQEQEQEGTEQEQSEEHKKSEDEQLERSVHEEKETEQEETEQEETEQEETDDLSDSDDCEYGEEPESVSNFEGNLHQYFLDSTINKTFENANATKEFFENFKDDMIADHRNIFKYEKTLRQMTKKPYYLLHSEDDLYVGRETFGNVWYICFRNLMMVDVDLGDSTSVLDENKIMEYKTFLQGFCDKPENKGMLFMLFKSRRGIHNFLVSHKKEFNHLENLEMMLTLKGDPFHSSFSYLRGYCCRLNKKTQNDLDNVYEFIGYIGDGLPLKSLMRQVMLHLDIIPYFEGHYCEGTTNLLLKKTNLEKVSLEQ